MNSKSEQWKILDNFPSPDNYMFHCLEQKLRASGKRQIMWIPGDDEKLNFT